MNEITSQILDQMDARKISKTSDQSGRSRIASEIIEIRKKDRELSANKDETERKISLYTEKIVDILSIKQQRADQLAERTKKILVRLKLKFGFDDKKTSEIEKEITDLQEQRAEIQQMVYGLERELKQLESTHSEIPSPADLLDSYYESVANTPLSQEQKIQLLKPEVLSELSM